MTRIKAILVKLLSWKLLSVFLSSESIVFWRHLVLQTHQENFSRLESFAIVSAHLLTEKRTFILTFFCSAFISCAYLKLNFFLKPTNITWSIWLLGFVFSKTLSSIVFPCSSLITYNNPIKRWVTVILKRFVGRYVYELNRNVSLSHWGKLESLHTKWSFP